MREKGKTREILFGSLPLLLKGMNMSCGMVNGGDLVGEVLKNEGVKCVFAVCGVHINPVLAAAERRGIRIISFRHEGGAVSAADGYARASGEVGVAAITAGMVGLVTEPILEAFTYGSPVVVIAGAVSLAGEGTGEIQDADQPTIVKSITKWCGRVKLWNRIPEFVGTAFRHARAGFPGPAFLDIPIDVLTTRGDASTVKLPRTSREKVGKPGGDPVYIEKALKLLLNAERPIIIAGPEVYWSKGWNELLHFAELTNIPVTYFLGLLGLIPYEHPLCVSGVFTGDADVALVIGQRANIHLTKSFMVDPQLIGPETKVIRVFPDETDIGAVFDVEIGIVGSARIVLEQMIEKVDKMHVGGCRTKQDKWLDELRARKEQYQEKLRRLEEQFWDQKPIHMARLSREVLDAIPRDATLILDGADCDHWFRKWACTFERYPMQVINVLDLGICAVGPGLPMAIGAKIAREDKQVICVTGDGAFGQYAMELETAAHNNIPIVVVVCNNSAWGFIVNYEGKCNLDYFTAPKWLTFERNLRYDKMAEALGCHGEYVDEPDQLHDALIRALNATKKGQPALVNVITDLRSNASMRFPGHTLTL